MLFKKKKLSNLFSMANKHEKSLNHLDLRVKRLGRQVISKLKNRSDRKPTKKKQPNTTKKPIIISESSEEEFVDEEASILGDPTGKRRSRRLRNRRLQKLLK